MPMLEHSASPGDAKQNAVSFDQWTLASLQEIIESLRHKPGAMLPILHAIQDRFGYIPPESVPLIADSLRQTRAEVHGVISFYHHFRTRPTGRHVLHLCRAEACQAVGARQLEAHVKSALGIDFHETTRDQEFTLEPVYCLGNCACGPSMLIDNKVHGRMSEPKFDRLVDDLTTATLELK